jgi:hypothetical protein
VCSGERHERNEALQRNGEKKGTSAASKLPINMLCPAPLKGGGVLSVVWGEHDARVKETIPI